jgi:hypothetical protein
VGKTRGRERYPGTLRRCPYSKNVAEISLSRWKASERWGLYTRGIVAQGFAARSDVGLEAKVEIRDGVLLMGEVTLAHVTFTFAFGTIE